MRRAFFPFLAAGVAAALMAAVAAQSGGIPASDYPECFLTVASMKTACWEISNGRNTCTDTCKAALEPLPQLCGSWEVVSAMQSGVPSYRRRLLNYDVKWVYANECGFNASTMPESRAEAPGVPPATPITTAVADLEGRVKAFPNCLALIEGLNATCRDENGYRSCTDACKEALAPLPVVCGSEDVVDAVELAIAIGIAPAVPSEPTNSTGGRRLLEYFDVCVAQRAGGWLAARGTRWAPAPNSCRPHSSLTSPTTSTPPLPRSCSNSFYQNNCGLGRLPPTQEEASGTAPSLEDKVAAHPGCGALVQSLETACAEVSSDICTDACKAALEPLPQECGSWDVVQQAQSVSSVGRRLLGLDV